MRDLEIRGAAAFSARPKSGHIWRRVRSVLSAVKTAVAAVEGRKARARIEVELRPDFVATNEAEFIQADRRLGTSRSFRQVPSPIHAAPSRLPISRELTTREQLGPLRKNGGSLREIRPQLTTYSFSTKSGSPPPGRASRESRSAKPN